MQKQTLVCLASGLAGTLLETMALLGLFGSYHLTQSHQRIWMVLLHVGACALFSPIFLRLLPPNYRQEKWLSLLLLLGFSITLPLVGLLLVFAYTQLIVRLRPAHNLESKFYFGETPYLTDRNDTAAFSKTTHSIVEILNSPNTETRRKAILAVRNLDLPSAIPILRRAQEDTDEQVRIFARNVLTHIIADLESALKMIEAEGLEAESGVDQVIYVIERYHEFVDLGLISEGHQGVYQDKAISLLARLHEREPANEKTLCLLLKYCLSKGRIDEARVYIGRLKELSSDPTNTLPWELEIAFGERDWGKLQTLLECLRRNHFPDPELGALRRFWLKRVDAVQAP